MLNIFTYTFASLDAITHHRCNECTHTHTHTHKYINVAVQTQEETMGVETRDYTRDLIITSYGNFLVAIAFLICFDRFSDEKSWRIKKIITITEKYKAVNASLNR